MDASLAAGREGSVAGEVEVVVGFQTCLVSCTPVKDENGALTFYVHLATDITRQKRAEKTAKDLAQKYRLISEQLPCSIWSTDRNLRYTSSAGAGLAMVGLKPGQLIGKTLCEFYGNQPEKETALEAYRHALAGEPQTFESQYRGRQFLASIEPFRDEKNEIIGTLGVGYDITEQKQMQFVLEQINKKHSLLGSITRHDARNKLSALMSYITLIKEEVTSPVGNGYIDKAALIVDQLAELIEFTQAYQSL